jgi:hypothetical protein
MNQSNSNLEREALIFMKREQQSHSREFLTEEEYFTVPDQPHTPGIMDAIILNFGDWLIKIGNGLKTRSVHTKLSEKQA